MNNEWANMRDVGRLFGKTSHDVGRILKHHGYRSENGKPTRKSHEGQLVREHFVNGFSSSLWHVERTSALLESLGWKKKHSSQI
jgi:hypothetical protein